jgi:hypothetical protein
MIGKVVIFNKGEWRVLSHKDDYLKVIEMADVVYPRIKTVPYSKISFRDKDVEDVILPEEIKL